MSTCWWLLITSSNWPHMFALEVSQYYNLLPCWQYIIYSPTSDAWHVYISSHYFPYPSSSLLTLTPSPPFLPPSLPSFLNLSLCSSLPSFHPSLPSQHLRNAGAFVTIKTAAPDSGLLIFMWLSHGNNFLCREIYVYIIMEYGQRWNHYFAKNIEAAVFFWMMVW